MASTDSHLHYNFRYMNRNHPLSSIHNSFNSQDVKDLQLLKNKLMAANNSASKASIYYTPPEEDDNLKHSQLNLQTSPVHINYINENLEHTKLELLDFKIQPKRLLINTPIQLESPTTINNLASMDDATVALSQLKITPDHPVGAGSIEDNHYAATIAEFALATFCHNSNQRHSAFSEDNAADDGSIELDEMHDFKDTNDVKNSKSCPVFYKVSKQNDGTTVHELLSEDLSKGLRLNKPSYEGIEEETPLHYKHLKETEKLNIILDENGKSSLCDFTLTTVALAKSENIKKDINQLSLDLKSNSNNKFNLPLQPLTNFTTAAVCDPNREVVDSLASSYSALTTPSSPISESSDKD